MSDEVSKKVLSVPPPPTDEIDSEWGIKNAEDQSATATAAADAGHSAPPPSGPADAQLKEELTGQGETAAAPGTPPPSIASDDQDDEDENGEDEDEDDEDEDDEDEDDEAPAARRSHAPVTRGSIPAAADDWIPDWAPWGTLGLLVLIGVIGGLGAFGHPQEAGSETAAAPAAGSALAAPATSPTSVS